MLELLVADGNTDILLVPMKLQRLALEVGDDNVELDINPLKVLPRGRGVVAVDALVVGR